MRNEATLCDFIQHYAAHQGSDQIASMEVNVWQKSCCYLMSYDLGLMVIHGHFTPVVVRRYWYFLILCDYKTLSPSFPYPQVLHRVHGPPRPPRPLRPPRLQLHHVRHIRHVRKSTVSATTSASNMSTTFRRRP